ncbi:MAG: WD40 repeat domain-containing protein [Salinarimonas sp.]|nr:WD40 repeat domain-containing protein [Salinarimonas sp.]
MNTIPDLTRAVIDVEAGAHVSAICFLQSTGAFCLGDGAVVLVRDAARHRVGAHPDGSILCAASDGERLVTGGDDGRVVVTGADGSTREFAASGGTWIDALALHHEGGIAWSAGRNVTARDRKGREKRFQAPSSARGLAFAPKGYRLAVAHYNGVSLWFPNLEKEPDPLEWKGSHLDVTWSPDGRFVVTSMQENALHGWRLAPDRGHMRMSGYAAKPRSLSWSADGEMLATSGADAVIAWPFDSKEGPTGKAPREFGVRAARVTRVACHPQMPICAAGYEDGCVLMIRISDGSELLVRPAVKGSPITALGWDPAGKLLGFGAADGAAGILPLP